MTTETNRSFLRFGLLGFAAAGLAALIHAALFFSGLTGPVIESVVSPIFEIVFFASSVSVLFFGVFPRFLKAIMGPYQEYYWREIETFRLVGFWIEDPVNTQIERDSK